MALLGGRRVLVAHDGAVRHETAPCREPLLDLVLVPNHGAAGPQLVGHGEHGVYRFDEPLGAPVVLGWTIDEILRVSSMPSVLAVWVQRAEHPVFLDVATGAHSVVVGVRGRARLDDKRPGARERSASGAWSVRPGRSGTPRIRRRHRACPPAQAPRAGCARVAARTQAYSVLAEDTSAGTHSPRHESNGAHRPSRGFDSSAEDPACEIPWRVRASLVVALSRDTQTSGPRREV